MSQHAALGRDVIAGNHVVKHLKQRCRRLKAVGCRIDADHGVADAKKQAVQGGDGDAGRIVFELGLLSPERRDAIVAACEELRAGKLHDQFVVDQIQGGAGTSTNMNANEVIANRALELMGHAKGEYKYLHPNEHVNMGQSTNDVYPTALRLAAWRGLNNLIIALESLRGAFADKGVEFSDILKMGRTQLQEAVPMTLGQEFNAFAITIGEDETRLAEAAQLLCEINLGATAIGTGITAHPEYAERVRARLAEITTIPVVTAFDLVEATQDTGAFVQVSGVLKRVAVKLSKICNDLRLLSSGPRAGFNEINLPSGSWLRTLEDSVIACWSLLLADWPLSDAHSQFGLGEWEPMFLSP